MTIEDATKTNADLFERGQRFIVMWKTIADPDAAREQALLTPNAIKFNRLEGAFFKGRAFWFDDTNGGENRLGQIFRYFPATNTLELFYEGNDPNKTEPGQYNHRTLPARRGCPSPPRRRSSPRASPAISPGPPNDMAWAPSKPPPSTASASRSRSSTRNHDPPPGGAPREGPRRLFRASAGARGVLSRLTKSFRAINLSIVPRPYTSAGSWRAETSPASEEEA